MLEIEKTLNDFQNYLLKGASDIEKAIQQTSQLTVQQRLEIYRDAYYLRLLEVLESDFRIFKAYMGASLFDQLGRDYIDAHPSLNPSIIRFGQKFPDFLKYQKIISPDQHELAQFEWMLEQASSKATLSSLTGDQLNQIAPEAWAYLYFHLNPSAILFHSNWGAPEIWLALDASRTGHLESTSAPVKASKKSEPATWLIWGNEGVAHFCLLDQEKTYLLKALHAQQSFGNVCEALCEIMSEDRIGEFVGNTLHQWVQDQIIVSYCSYKNS